jgi:DNA-binding NarL/FixJ family response regulator
VGNSHAVAPLDRAARILLLDPHPMVARALAVALDRNSDIDVVSTAGSLGEGLPLAREFRPAVVILHDPLPDATVASAVQALLASVPDACVLVVRSKVTHRFAERALAAGAAAVIDRSAQFAVLEHAVRACARGEMSAINRNLLPGAFGSSDPDAEAHSSTELIAREREVLTLLDAGLDAARIAEQLMISRNTARNHIQRVLVKLGAHSKLEAVAIARREGLLAR